tara:strand:+ start:1164 stop:1469 length:306 start_codon:yes stop_codon:yes gene_type:complete
MSEYDNTNKGVLFPNSYKNKSNQPDVKGNINIKGEDFKLAGWIRTKKDSEDKFFSLVVEVEDEEPQVAESENPIDAVMTAPAPTPIEGLPPSEQEDGDVPF